MPTTSKPSITTWSAPSRLIPSGVRGLARVITDAATYAYLADVYVLEDHRGRGLAKWLMEVIMAHPALQGLRRFALSTRDAHALYRQFGFELVASPERQMEIMRRNIYLESSLEDSTGAERRSPTLLGRAYRPRRVDRPAWFGRPRGAPRMKPAWC